MQGAPQRQCRSPGIAWQSLRSLTGNRIQGEQLWHQRAEQPAGMQTSVITWSCTGSKAPEVAVCSVRAEAASR